MLRTPFTLVYFNSHMDNASPPPEIGADDFARRFSLRTQNLMWLLGAGASASPLEDLHLCWMMKTEYFTDDTVVTGNLNSLERTKVG